MAIPDPVTLLRAALAALLAEVGGAADEEVSQIMRTAPTLEVALSNALIVLMMGDQIIRAQWRAEWLQSPVHG